MSRTIVIGWDSASWAVITPLLRQGKLPNLKMLIDNGAAGNLYSTIVPMTPLAWTSIVTGVNPGKHGIYDFFTQDRQTYRVTPVNYTHLTRPALWDIFNSYGRKVVVVNFPLAFPPPKIDSCFISGIGASEKAVFAHPESMMKSLRNSKYKIYPGYSPTAKPKQYLRELKNLTDIQVDVVMDRIRHRDWELMLAVFMGIDWVQHYFWDKKINDANPVHDFYQYMDSKLGQIIAQLESDCNIVVLSDHGARKIKGEIHLNTLLEDWGYLARNNTSRGISPGFRSFVLRGAGKIARFLPDSIKKWGACRLTDQMRQDLRQLQGDEHTNLQNIIDWKKTKAFSYGYMGHVFIHKQGEYPLGTVRPGREYDLLCEEIMTRLKSLENPNTGKPLIGEVFRREQIFTGRRQTLAPDIIFNPVDFAYTIYGDFAPRWFHPPHNRLADHDRNGMVIMKGPNIRRNVGLDAEVLDITPTILHWHQIPKLQDMDGRVLTEALAGADQPLYKKTHRINVINNFNELKPTENKKDQKIIERQLRNLGYL